MILRRGWILGLGVALAAAPAFGQAPTNQPAPRKPAAATQRTTRAPAPPAASAQLPQPGVPHTLAEALAATYANQPALQAERAKLRATDENVPQALGRMAPHGRDGGDRRLRRWLQPHLFWFFRRFSQRSDRSAHRHCAGDTHPADL